MADSRSQALDTLAQYFGNTFNTTPGVGGRGVPPGGYPTQGSMWDATHPLAPSGIATPPNYVRGNPFLGSGQSDSPGFLDSLLGSAGIPGPPGPGRAMQPTGAGPHGLSWQDVWQFLGTDVPNFLTTVPSYFGSGAAAGEGGQAPPQPSMQGVQAGGSTAAGGGGGGGGSSYTLKGSPFPSEGPKVAAPQYDIAAMFDPILSQLEAPKRIAEPSKIAGLAQILGGAAAGAQRGLDTRFGGYASTGSVISGAGAGAASALSDLRHEQQALEVEYQRSLQQVNNARAGVLAQRAGAEIDLARSTVEAQNKQAELDHNNKVQRAMFSQSQVQAAGDGRLIVMEPDPDTGNTTMRIIDTVSPLERAQTRTMQMMLLRKRLGMSEKKEADKIILDGKQYERDALLGFGDDMTDLEVSARDAALRILNNPAMLGKYQQELEGNYLPNEASESERQRYDAEPQHMLYDYIFQNMLRSPGDRAAAFSLATTGTIPKALEE